MSLAFSIIIPTFNRLDTLPEVLAAVDLLECSGGFEVVVVDDRVALRITDLIERGRKAESA